MIDDTLTIQFHAGASQQLKDFAIRYWERRIGDSSGGFYESVSAIAKDAKMGAVDFLEALRQWSTVFLANTRCGSCNDPLEVDCRSELLKKLKYPVCNACFSAGFKHAAFGASAGTGQVIGLRPGCSAPSSAEVLDGRQAAEPIKIFADHIISLEEFQKDPAGALAACSGAPLIVMSDNRPLFYCMPPERMRASSESR